MLDLISVMLIRSGNEAANAVAEYLAGSVESFADLMNQTAQMLGCSPNTHFANPSGVHDENHYTTARDLAVIAQACMKDERFASIVSQTSYDMPATQTESGAAGHPRRTIVGSTAILNPENETSYYRYATGVKTGYTLAAGYCFVGSATKGGIDLISVVLYDGDTRRYEDTKRLFEYGFTQIESITPESLYAEDPLPTSLRAAGYGADGQGAVLTPPILREDYTQLRHFLRLALRWATERYASYHVWAVLPLDLEHPDACDDLCAQYLSAGLTLRGMRPMVGADQMLIFSAHGLVKWRDPLRRCHLADPALPRVLERGYAAADFGWGKNGLELVLRPV